MVKTEIFSRNQKGEPTGVLIKLPPIREMLEREVMEFGTGGHILVNKKHIGKKAKVIIYDD